MWGRFLFTFCAEKVTKAFQGCTVLSWTSPKWSVMDFTPEDMRIAAAQGDAVNLVRLVAGFPTTSTRMEEESITCPWPGCRASPGQRCTTPRGRKLPSRIHDSRIKEYRNAPEQKKNGAWPT